MSHGKTMMLRLKSWTNPLLDLLFPPICVACSTQGLWLCKACIHTAIGCSVERCLVCKELSPHGRTCRECRRVTPLDGIVSIGPYQHDALRKAVHALKYDGVAPLAHPLAALLAHRVADMLSATGADIHDTALVPLPLHRRRERRRGFNQAALLSHALSLALALPSRTMLSRIRSTTSQSRILASAAAARRENLTNAFVPAEQQNIPAHVILIDDVATTCASLEAAAEVLYDLGVRSVWGAVVCKG